MGSGGDDEVALGDLRGNFASENLAESRRCSARQEMLQWFTGVASGVKLLEEAGDGVGHFARSAAIADGASDGGDMADATAYAEIIGVYHVAVVLDLFAFDADIGDPVLAAGIGAAGDMEAEIFLIVRKALFELLGEPAGEGFRFGEREFAELGAGAGHGATGEGGDGIDREAGGVEFADNVVDVGFRNVDKEEILHGGVANVAVAVTLGEIGGEPELRGRDATANDGGADGEQAGLFLRDDTEMIAVGARRELFGFGGIEGEAEFGVQSGKKGFSSPVVFEKQEFEASFFSGLAKDFGFAENFGDGADDADHLVRTDEYVEAEGEMRLRGEAAADAEGEAHFLRE